MKERFHVSQLDDVFQFISDTPDFDYGDFSFFLDALYRDHPAYHQWELANRQRKQDEANRRNVEDEVFYYLRNVHNTAFISSDFWHFLRFILERYGTNREGIEHFKKSLGTVKPYQEWLAVKTGKKVAAKTQAVKRPITAGHLRLVQ